MTGRWPGHVTGENLVVDGALGLGRGKPEQAQSAAWRNEAMFGESTATSPWRSSENLTSSAAAAARSAVAATALESPAAAAAPAAAASRPASGTRANDG